MLADLIADSLNYTALDPRIRAQFEAAHKFVFRDQVCQEALDFPTAPEWDEFCRLPYSRTWIEFSAFAMTSAEERRALPRGTKNPLVGYLVLRTQPVKFAREAAVHIFTETISGIPMHASTFGLGFAAGGGMHLMRTRWRDDPTPANYDDEPNVEAFGPDAWAIRNCLLAINVRKFCDQSLNEPAGNARRARKGRRPLFSHHVCTIREHTVREATAAEGEAGAERRAHSVRGHPRQIDSGVTWVRPHLRGNPALGFITKDYQL